MKKIKFTIIIPAYNSEKTIKRCIESVLSQTYKNYEIIVVNDGSNDETRNIIEKEFKNVIKLTNQENSGLSSARNSGIKMASGDYILFLDSDDYLDSEILDKLYKTIENEDVVRFQIRRIEKDNFKDYYETPFKGLSGEAAFDILCSYHYVEPACFYAYKRRYWIDNKYQFTIGRYHEDFGLIPLVISQAASVTSINEIGYNYVECENSITTTVDSKINIKKANDVLYFYEELASKNVSPTLKSFAANAVIIKSKVIKGKEKIEYLKKIKEIDVPSNILDNSIKRKIKKIILKIYIDLQLVIK